MSFLVSVAGLIIAYLFFLAGFRTGTGMRNQKLIDAITYHGRIQAIYDGMRSSAALSMATLVRQVGLMKSRTPSISSS